jgi:hypothetical protein
MANTAIQVRTYCEGIEYVDNEIKAIYYGGGRIKYNGNNMTASPNQHHIFFGNCGASREKIPNLIPKKSLILTFF